MHIVKGMTVFMQAHCYYSGSLKSFLSFYSVFMQFADCCFFLGFNCIVLILYWSAWLMHQCCVLWFCCPYTRFLVQPIAVVQHCYNRSFKKNISKNFTHLWPLASWTALPQLQVLWSCKHGTVMDLCLYTVLSTRVAEKISRMVNIKFALCN